MGAANVLQKAIFEHLAADTDLSALLGGGIVSDRLHERVKLPAIILTEIDSRDFSTSTEKGEEHFVTIDIWTDGNSRKQALQLACVMRDCLDEAALDLGSNQHLVSLRFLDQRNGREKAKAEQSIRLRFRAVSEEVPSGGA